MTTPFPQSSDFTGHNEPMRVECDIYDLVVEGLIPTEINGMWYRGSKHFWSPAATCQKSRMKTT